MGDGRLNELETRDNPVLARLSVSLSRFLKPVQVAALAAVDVWHSQLYPADSVAPCLLSCFVLILVRPMHGLARYAIWLTGILSCVGTSYLLDEQWLSLAIPTLIAFLAMSMTDELMRHKSVKRIIRALQRRAPTWSETIALLFLISWLLSSLISITMGEHLRLSAGGLESQMRLNITIAVSAALSGVLFQYKHAKIQFNRYRPKLSLMLGAATSIPMVLVLTVAPGSIPLLVCWTVVILIVARYGFSALYLSHVAMMSFVGFFLYSTNHQNFWDQPYFIDLYKLAVLVLWFHGGWISGLVDQFRQEKSHGRLFGAAFNHLSVGLLVVRQQGDLMPVVEQVNDTLIQMTLSGAKIQRGAFLNELEDLGKHWLSLIASGSNGTLEVDLYDANHSMIHVLLTAKRMLGRGRTFDQTTHTWLLQCIDLTPQWRAREALRRGEQRARMFFEFGPLLMWQHDISQRRVKLNSAAMNYFGIHQSDIDLELFLAYFAQSDREVYLSWLDWVDHPQHIEFGLTGCDGDRRNMLVSAVQLDDLEHGRQLIGCAIDVQERINLQNQLVELSRTLDQRVSDRTAEIESFSYAVSHDFRTTLRGINSNARFLKIDYGEFLPANGLQRLDKIGKLSDDMADLMDDLLQLSKLSMDRLKFEPTNLNAIANQVAKDVVKDLVVSKRIIDFQIGELPWVEGQPALLRQVIVNLFGNSVKFTSKQDHSMISLNFEAGWFVFKDNGIGFDANFSRKIFEPFHKMHPQQGYDGYGIGLALVHRIVTRHHGVIVAESDLGHGATFKIQLPLSGGAVKADATEPGR